MNSFIEILKIFATALLGWLVLWGYFAIAEKWPRIWFVIVHYSISVLTFVLMSWLYVRYIRGTNGFESFGTMIAFMVSLFTVEVMFFRYVYDKPTWFLNFTDWIVPVFLIASTIYLMANHFIKS